MNLARDKSDIFELFKDLYQRLQRKNVTAKIISDYKKDVTTQKFLINAWHEEPRQFMRNKAMIVGLLAKPWLLRMLKGSSWLMTCMEKC